MFKDVGEAQITHGQDTNEDAAWVSEGSDSPGAIAVNSHPCGK